MSSFSYKTDGAALTAEPSIVLFNGGIGKQEQQLGNQEKSDDNRSQEQQNRDQSEHGHSGEGAASAMQQLISQTRQHRHQTGEADDAAGGHGQ
jgi:hypothetical protein